MVFRNYQIHVLDSITHSKLIFDLVQNQLLDDVYVSYVSQHLLVKILSDFIQDPNNFPHFLNYFLGFVCPHSTDCLLAHTIKVLHV